MLGVRLKAERERLGMTQEVFASAAGAGRRTLADWEKGVSSPTGWQLAELAALGADVQYIVTGQRQGHGIGESAIHQAVLDAVDLLSLDTKVDAAQLAKAITKLVARTSSTASERGPIARFGGVNNGQVAETIIGASVVNAGRKKP